MTTTSLIFKDPIYGVNGLRIFPGSHAEAKIWFNEINRNEKNFLGSRFSVEDFLDEPEAWSGAEYLRCEAKVFNADPNEDYYSRLTKYFIERYTPIAHWTPVELWMSLFYKCLCYQINPQKGALCDIEYETYDITNMDYRMDIKKFFLNGNIESALAFSGADLTVRNNDKDSPVTNEMFSYLFDFILYNSHQRDNIKQEISLLFQRNPWIFNGSENKEALMGFLLIQLSKKEDNLIRLLNINKETLEETVKIFSETLLFLFTLGFPELDLTPFKETISRGLLKNFKISSEKSENILKEKS